VTAIEPYGLLMRYICHSLVVTIRYAIPSSLSFHTLLLLLQQPLALQILRNFPHTILNTLQITADMNLGLLRRLIRRTDARKLWDLALPRLLVQALWIARLCYLEREVDEDFDESEGRVGARGYGVQVARGLAVGFVRRDEGCYGDCGAVGEELCDL
jgi:hypothetical protein